MKKLTCRFSRLEDVPRLKGLWKDCFGDEDAYIDHYFDTFYRPDRALVLEQEGEVCSMLLTFSFFMTLPTGESLPVCYVYAFCTDPSCQSRGFGRRLLSYAEETARGEGCAALFMIPGEKSLFDFYRSLGYETGASFRSLELEAAEEGTLPVQPCSVEDYAARREAWLADLPHISYDSETLHYQHRLCRSTGGGFYRVGEGIAAVEVDEEAIFVKELLSTCPEKAISALLRTFHLQKALVRLPALPDEEKQQPFAVVKWLNADQAPLWKGGWLAFGFD